MRYGPMSVTSCYCIETDKWIELIFEPEANLGLSCNVSEKNSGISEIRALPSKTSSQTLEVENFDAEARRPAPVLST